MIFNLPAFILSATLPKPHLYGGFEGGYPFLLTLATGLAHRVDAVLLDPLCPQKKKCIAHYRQCFNMVEPLLVGFFKGNRKEPSQQGTAAFSPFHLPIGQALCGSYSSHLHMLDSTKWLISHPNRVDFPKGDGFHVAIF